MKLIVKMMILTAIMTVGVSAQADCEQNGGTKKCQLVPQVFVDTATFAFKENVALKKANKTESDAKEAWKVTAQARKQVIDTQKALIAVKDKQIEKLIKVTCTKSSFLIFVYRSKKCF